jgi:hypothetical protein
MLNVTVPTVYITCAPKPPSTVWSDAGGNIIRQLAVPNIPIKADGSFAGTATEDGVLGTFKAKFTYSFSGRFQGLDANGKSSVAGSLREDITFTDAVTAYSCTSNSRSWTASRTS